MKPMTDLAKRFRSTCRLVWPYHRRTKLAIADALTAPGCYIFYVPCRSGSPAFVPARSLLLNDATTNGTGSLGDQLTSYVRQCKTIVPIDTIDLSWKHGFVMLFTAIWSSGMQYCNVIHWLQCSRRRIDRKCGIRNSQNATASVSSGKPMDFYSAIP